MNLKMERIRRPSLMLHHIPSVSLPEGHRQRRGPKNECPVAEKKASTGSGCP